MKLLDKLLSQPIQLPQRFAGAARAQLATHSTCRSARTPAARPLILPQYPSLAGLSQEIHLNTRFEHFRTTMLCIRNTHHGWESKCSRRERRLRSPDCQAGRQVGYCFNNRNTGSIPGGRIYPRAPRRCGSCRSHSWTGWPRTSPGRAG